MANQAFDAVNKIGWPEGRIILSEATIYLATSPKSNAAYNAINQALQYVKETGDLAVPLHLRNAPTQLMQKLNYGQDYKYAHDYPGHFVVQQYLPDGAVGQRFYDPQPNSSEEKIRERMRHLWQDRY